MDKDDLEFWGIIVGVIALIIVGIVAAFSTIEYYSAKTYDGQTYDVTVTVQAVEHSTRWTEHTNLWARVYGDQDITYTFNGYQNFTLGQNYHIVFKDYVQSTWWGLDYEAWGKVQSIEPAP